MCKYGHWEKTVVTKIEPIKHKEGYYTVTPYESIDNESHQEFYEKIRSIFSESLKGILIDLRHVEYISSAGLGVLFTTKKYMMGIGGELYFCNLKPQIKKLFEIVKTLKKETLFKDNDEADGYFYAIMNEEIKKQRDKPKPI